MSIFVSEFIINYGRTNYYFKKFYDNINKLTLKIRIRKNVCVALKTM